MREAVKSSGSVCNLWAQIPAQSLTSGVLKWVTYTFICLSFLNCKTRIIVIICIAWESREFINVSCWEQCLIHDKHHLLLKLLLLIILNTFTFFYFCFYFLSPLPIYGISFLLSTPLNFFQSFKVLIEFFPFSQLSLDYSIYSVLFFIVVLTIYSSNFAYGHLLSHGTFCIVDLWH